jgi:hypothetical protein
MVCGMVRGRRPGRLVRIGIAARSGSRGTRGGPGGPPHNFSYQYPNTFHHSGPIPSQIAM